MCCRRHHTHHMRMPKHSAKAHSIVDDFSSFAHAIMTFIGCLKGSLATVVMSSTCRKISVQARPTMPCISLVGKIILIVAQL